MQRFFSFFLLIVFASALKSQVIQPCEFTPLVNQEVLNFVKLHLNKKVGRGECWDLAAEALDKSGADWDHAFSFGKKINYRANECLSPGDIIQFKNVKLSYKQNNSVYSEAYKKHTAIIYEIKADGSLIIAQQNTSDHGRKVSLDPFDLKNLQSGTVEFFRPQKK